MSKCLRPECGNQATRQFCSGACRVAYFRMRQKFLQQYSMTDLLRLAEGVVFAYRQNNYLALLSVLKEFDGELAKFVATGLPEPGPSSLLADSGGDTSAATSV